MLRLELSDCQTFGIFSPPPSLKDDPAQISIGRLIEAHSNHVTFTSPSYFTTDELPSFKSIHSPLKHSRAEVKSWLKEQGACQFAEAFKLEPDAQNKFLETGELLKAEIASGSLKKGVPYSFRFANRAPSLQERAGILLAALEQQEKTGGYLCGLWDDAGGLIVLTPEVLFERSGETVETAALAGTRLNPLGGLTPAEKEGVLTEWLNDPKEKAEHEWVVKGILDSLKPYGELKVEPISIKESGMLMHLETKISAFQVKAASATLLQNLHPTPALGAFPRKPGLEWLLAENKKLPRSKYGAPIGIFFPEEKIEIYLVAIRGIEWCQSPYFCQMGAGAGVVAQSKMTKEWVEVEAKWRSIAKSMNLTLDENPA